MTQDNGASLRDRAVVNGAGQAVSAVPAYVPSADWRDGADLSGFKWPLSSYAPGSYLAKCKDCGDTMMGVDKRALLCLRCAIEAIVEQRTVFERALRIRIWNEAKGRGVSDRAAMAEIEEVVQQLTAQAIEARSGETRMRLDPKDEKGSSNG